MIFTKMKEWFKSFKKAPLWVCSLLTIAFVGGVATACRDKGGDNSSNINSEQTVTTYTVTFETNGGNSIAPISMEEGSVLSKPTDPQKAGSKFVGWYTDSTFKTPFYFDVASAKITQDVTLYARWEVSTDAVEYVIDFNTNVEGLSYDSVETVNNKAFVGMLPNPVRVGYTFAGWAISMYDDAAKVSYMFQDGMTIAEHTTFHALWNDDASEKLATPVVNVTANGINWKAVSGVSTYHVTISGPMDFQAIATNTGSTTHSIDFANAPIGDYEISVTAVASNTTKNSDPAVRNYINKALTRVSHYAVEDTKFSFTPVENATDYLLTISCGDDRHNHTDMTLNGQTEYDFANCLTKSGKVEFKVTSVAEGYVSVQSRAFSYTKALDAVTGLAVNEETGSVVWEAVENAEKYVVTVDCGNATHEHTNVVVGDTQYDLKECEAKDGGINVSVYAIASEYGNSEVATYNYVKTTLATPGNVTISGTTMSWDAVARATGYKVKIGNETIDVTTNSIDLSAQQIAWVEANDYVINLQAVNANGASLWSNNIDARYYAMYTSISYAEGIVSWNHVIGATAYKVKVNGGEEVTISNGKNYAPVVLTQAGDNTISVCYTDGETTSDWVTTTVVAYAIEFDTLVSDIVIDTQYKAVGDPVDSFYLDIKKAGYNFYGWYRGEKVGPGNESLYEDEYFKDTESIKLYADYTPKSYEVTYDYGTDGTGVATGTTVTVGEHYQFAIPTPTSDSVFGGWYTAPQGKGTPLTDEYGVSLNPWSIAVDEVVNGGMVYAYWNNYVIEFTETKLAGSNATVYAVSKGARINTVDELTIPQSYRGKPVKVIAAHAFLDCTKLKKIYIPNTVEQIFTTGAMSFDGCTLLEEINIIPVEGNRMIRYWSQDGVLFDNGRLDEQDGTVEVAAFPMNYKSTTYRIPEGVTTVPSEAFEGANIEEVIFSPDIVSIETRAFYSAKSLTTLTFEDPKDGEPAKGLVIEDRAFESCSELTVVNLPARLESIQTKKYDITGTYESSGPAYEQVSTSHSTSSTILDAFYSCSKLKAINVAEGCANYSSENGVLFNGDKTTIIYAPRYFEVENGVYRIPQGVTKIEGGAFIYCYNIKSLYIPSTVTDIGEYAFYSAYYIDDITFGGNGFADVTIGKYAFRNVYNIKSLVFEENSRVTSIGEGAFMYNYEIKSLTIPATVTELGDGAFRGWSYLTEVVFEEPTKEDAELTFGDAVFYQSRIATLNIPAHASDLGGIFNGLSKLKTIVVDEDNKYYTTVSGILYDIDKTEMLYFPKELTEGYTLPDTLQIIGPGIFEGNNKLETFEVPNTVTTIGTGAFRNSGLRTLTFEAGNDEVGLTIENDAFRDCDRLQSLALPKRTTSIGSYSLAYMDNLTSLSLGEGLTEIGMYAIYTNTNLKSVAIPDNVTKIGYYGVGNNQKLESITFGKNSKLEEVGGWGLANNKAMESIELPASLKKLGYYSMHQGSGTTRGKLSSVTFAEGSQLEQIGSYAFYYVAIKEITIPKTVTAIDYYAFAYSTVESVLFEKGSDEDLKIGAPCEYYSSSSATKPSTGYGYAFAYTKLKAIEIPARVTEIGTYAFYNVHTLESVTFEEGKTSQLQQIGNYAFRYCEGLTTIELPRSLTNLGGRTVGSTTYNRTAIGHYAFADCPNLKNVHFEMEAEGYDPAKVRPMTFGIGVFINCTALEEIDLPSRFITYENDLSKEVFNAMGVRMTNRKETDYPQIFNGCENLKAINVIMDSNGNSFLADNEISSKDGALFSVDGKTLMRVPVGRVDSYEIPNTVEKIDEYAFWDANKLTGVTFQAGNEDTPLVIGAHAFDGCASLTTISLAKRVTSLEPEAFVGCIGLTSIDLSTKLAAFDATVFDGCINLAAVNAAPDSTIFSSHNGVLFNAGATEADLHTLYYYPASRTDKVYSVPSAVKTIYRYAFYDNANLEEVILPESLQAIDDYAFYNASGLKNIHIRKNVTNIGDYAFYNCTSLENLTFEEGGLAPLSIGNESYVNTSKWANSATGTSYTYNGCTFANCYSLTNVTLPVRTKIITDNAFYNCLGLRSINIPANVEKLGSGAFRYCERLETVDIDPTNSKLTVIPVRLFEYCYSLKSFVIPASVTEIAAEKANSSNYFQSNAFAWCKSLETFEFADGCQIESLPIGMFAGCASLKKIEIPASVTEIKSGGSSYTNYGVFYNCTNLKDITFEEGSNIEYIGNYAFYGCAALETFDIPETVTEMGTYVFGNCASLDNVVFHEDIAIDGSDYMFYNCSSLTTVTLPESMMCIPCGFFSGCSSLTDFEIPDHIVEVYDSAFSETGITSVTIRTGVYYEYYSFANMGSLVEIIFEDGVDTIADDMFENCDALETVVIPDSVTYIGYYAFAYCDNLKSVKLPTNDDYTYLSDDLFEDSPMLTDVVIPQQITEIGYYAFFGTGITEIDIPDNVTTIYDDAFSYCKNLKSITIPKSVTEIYYYAFEHSTALEEVIFEEGSMLEYIDDSTFYNCQSLKSIVLPDSVGRISGSAFQQCSSLESINIPEMCVNVDFNAFIGCKSLKEINIHPNNEVYVVEDGVVMNNAKTEILLCLPQKTGSYTIPEDVTIRNGAFANTNLDEIVLPASLKTIPQYWFSGISEKTALTIPEGVEVIDQYAFAYSEITTINIPASVSKIGNYAFYYCENLKTLNIVDGTVRLNIGNYAFEGCSSLESVVIPARLREDPTITSTTYALGSYVFKNCTSLKSVTFEETTEEIGVDGVLTIGSETFSGCTALTSVELPSALGDGSYTSTSGSTYSISAMSSKVFYNCSSLSSVKFNEVEGQDITLGVSIFDGCTSLKSIELPSTLISIGGRIFANSGLESIVIPESVTKFGTTGDYYVNEFGVRTYSSYMGLYFENCANLKSVTIKAQATELPMYTFRDCPALEEVIFETETITEIEYGAFSGCTSIASLTIPASVTTIGGMAFEGWTASQTINVNKTEKQCNAMTVLWTLGCNANMVYLPEA